MRFAALFMAVLLATGARAEDLKQQDAASEPAPPAALPRPQVIYVQQQAAPPSHKTAYVLGVTALATLGVGVLFGMKAQSKADELTRIVHDQAGVNDIADSHKSKAIIADLLFGASGVLGLATVIAW